MPEHLSLKRARRIALAAQGFGAAHPGLAAASQLRRTVDRLGLHQIDSVNVLVRAHYLPAFSRLGSYDRALLDRDAWGPKRSRRLFEYWAHEASLLPVELQPLLRWRMARAERGEIGWKGLRRFATERRAEADAVLARIAAEGPKAASDFENGSSKSGWWEWSEAKLALEWLFWSGQITTATRRGSFERVYDLPERVLPSDIIAQPTPDPETAQRALIERSARALGVATSADLRDYYRLKPEEADHAIAALAEEGVLVPAAVEGWSQKAWLHRDTRLPRRVRGAALLAPFDPLVWERARTERLFGFRYRIEIYVPQDKRVHGYYVLPFLMDEALVARVDLKADRQGGRLLAHRITLEPGPPADTEARLAVELERLAEWLGLGEVRVGETVRAG
ncbi:winged helix DNA-binding domain-containing protein [Sphingomonas psychrotolerans]|uniref:Winged helix DNA-binding domain-containing protein n=1 Tax=Sphingomonas psychrotolerans TaxID=1327635 RepID=A0ABU3N6F9_9SPHN|nr:crosslink repair DNA glycosylase YcaQ family protein [Sphingomonas psychrotolerans]MDT8760122.1 winged helix DNA-binding domain-containing protein [Sphingomonas psychrotolerans]